MARAKKYKLDRVSIRMVKDPPIYSPNPVECTTDAVRLMSDTFKDMDREVLGIVSLRNDLVPINMSIVSMGTINACLAHPREIMKTPILSNAGSMLLFHNHPSGNLTPSKEDIALTDHIAKLGQMLEIPLLDHIILGRGDQYYSFRENAVLPISRTEYAKSVEAIRFQPVSSIVSDKPVQFGRAEKNRIQNIKAQHKKAVTNPKIGRVQDTKREV